jgi:AcrR family transcriptional regulator
MSPRAPSLSPDERRAAILAAAVPLLMEHGHATTTKQIADAAGIAEGTVFRVFATKHDLIDAALDTVFDPTVLLTQLAEVSADQPLRGRLLEVATRLQAHFLDIFRLMTSLGIPPPASKHRGNQVADWKARANDLMIALVTPDAAQLRVPPAQVIRLLRLLTFAGSHPHITEHQMLTPAEIVEVILDGVWLPDDRAKISDKDDSC